MDDFGRSGAEAPSGQSPSGLSQSSLSQAKPTVPNAEWPEVEWEDGYPTAEDDDFLAWAGLPLNFNEAAKFVLRELPRAAENCVAFCEVEDAFEEHYPDEPIKRIQFSTGGWSGAESLLGFISSRFDTRHFMESWRRGGHYVFEVPMHFLASGMSAGTSETNEDLAQSEGRQPGPKGTPK
jgi:hypothetical protein